MTITLTREEAQQVLDALVFSTPSGAAPAEVYKDAVVLLQNRLEQPDSKAHLQFSGPMHVVCKCDKCKAQPEPEPVAWFMERTFMDGTPSFIQVCETDPEFYTPLYRAPQPEPKDDGHCQACDGNHCTAKTGCVALSNPPQNKWESQIERKYSPDGVLLSEKIKYTPDGEWQDLKQYPVAWWYDMGDVIDLNVSGHGIPLYFAPPQREWQGLTDEERTYLAWESNNGQHCVAMTEAKLKEKNA